MISLVLGVPLADVAKFRAWSEEITSSVGHHSCDPDRTRQVQDEFFDYISELLDGWDGVVGTSVLSQIAAAERAGELTGPSASGSWPSCWSPGTSRPPTTSRAASCCWPPTPTCIGKLRADPALVRPFIEESLRLEAPIQGFYRFATATAEIGGVTIPAGLAGVRAVRVGEHDDAGLGGLPAPAARPAERRAHLAFGKGAHTCMGSALARLEGQVVVEVLLDRLESSSC